MNIEDTTEIETLLADIRGGMTENYESRQTIKAERKADQQYEPMDVEAKRAEFQALVDKGLTDINVGDWRASGDSQTTNDSQGPDTQIREISAWAFAHPDVLRNKIDIWVWDIESGTHESRVGLDLVREFVASGKVDNVVSFRFDRLARTQLLSEEFRRDCKKHGVKWRSATENIPSGPLGVMIQQFIIAMAAYELAIMSIRMLGGRKTSVIKNGVYAGGQEPYGYRARGRRGTSGHGILNICEVEARIVTLIFRLYRMGYSFAAIARWLTRQGVPQRHNGLHGWDGSQIRRIIKSEAAYRAEGIFGDWVTETEAIAHPPILPTRPPEERTYLLGTVKMLPRGSQVPDDIVSTPIPPTPVLASVQNLTADQARMLLRLFALRDQGHTQTRCGEILNDWGLTTLRGHAWTLTSVFGYLSRRARYEAAIAKMGVTLDVYDVTAPSSDSQNGQGAETRAKSCMEDLRDKGLSYGAIAERLADLGHRTRTGGRWHRSTIQRVLAGKQRRGMAFANEVRQIGTSEGAVRGG